MRQNEIEAVLAMVQRSAEKVAVEELDFFEEYAQTARQLKDLPDVHSAAADDTSAAFIDGHVLVGMSLTLLGQIAKELLSALRQKAIEAGASSLWAFLKSKGDLSQIAKETSNEITVKIVLPKGVKPSDVHYTVTLQLNALADQEQIAKGLT